MVAIVLTGVFFAALGAMAGAHWTARSSADLARVAKASHEARVRDLHKEIAALGAEVAEVDTAKAEMRRAKALLRERESAGDCFDELAMLTVCVNAYITEGSVENLEAMSGALQVAQATLALPTVRA